MNTETRLGLSCVAPDAAALWAEQLNNFGPTVVHEIQNAGYVTFYHAATQPAAWEADPPGLSVCTSWARHANSPNWPMLLLGPSPKDLGPRVILVRPSFQPVTAAPGDLAVLSDAKRLWALAGAGGAGWAIWLAAPSFWPHWLKLEAERLGLAAGASGMPQKSRAPSRARGPGG